MARAETMPRRVAFQQNTIRPPFNDGSVQIATMPSRDHSFESQAKPVKTRLSGIGRKNIRSVDVSPQNPDPENADVPILVLPGLGGGVKSDKGLWRILTGMGRRVISFSYPRQGIWNPEKKYKAYSEQARDTQGFDYTRTMNERWEKLRGLPKVTQRRWLTALAFLDEKKIEKADIVAISEAGTETAELGKLDKIRNVVVVDPAGGLDKDGTFKLIGRSIKNWVSETFVPKKAENAKTSDPQMNQVKKQLTKDRLSPIAGLGNLFSYAISNPWRTWQELRAITNSRTRKSLQEIRSKGHRVGWIHAVLDKVFPMDRVLRELNRKPGIAPVDNFLKVKEGGHNAVYDNPKVLLAAGSLLKQYAAETKSTAA